MLKFNLFRQQICKFSSNVINNNTNKIIKYISIANEISANEINQKINRHNPDTNINKINYTDYIDYRYRDANGNINNLLSVKSVFKHLGTTYIKNVNSCKKYDSTIGNIKYLDAMENEFMPDADKKDLISFQIPSGICGLYLTKLFINILCDNVGIVAFTDTARIFYNDDNTVDYLTNISIPDITCMRHENIFNHHTNYYYKNLVDTGNWNCAKFRNNIDYIYTDSRYYNYYSPVLFHTCAHNPTGKDLSPETWNNILTPEFTNSVFPIFDTAFAGFASGSIKKDTYALSRAIESKIPFMSIFSCSYNFGIYNIDCGMLSFYIPNITDEERKILIAFMTYIIKLHYNDQCYIGSVIVETILNNKEFYEMWQLDILNMYKRIRERRGYIGSKCAKLLNISKEVGMFSLLDLSPEQIKKLETKYNIYTYRRPYKYEGMCHINLTSIPNKNLDNFCNVINEC